MLTLSKTKRFGSTETVPSTYVNLIYGTPFTSTDYMDQREGLTPKDSLSINSLLKERYKIIEDL